MRGETLQTGSLTLRFWHITESRDELTALCRERGIDCTHITEVKSNKRACEMLAELLLIQDFDKKWVLAHDENGAPYIKGKEQTFISITHSDDIMCVATALLPFGIDIELNTEKILRVRERFLNTEELTFFPDDDRLHHMMAWTAKEAMYKASSTKGIDFRNDIRLAPDLRSGMITHDDETKHYDIRHLWYGNREFLVTIATFTTRL